MKKARSEKEIEGKSREIESWSLAHTHACEYFLFSFSWKDLISTKSCKFLSDPSSSKGYYFFFQYFLNVADSDVERYLKLFTFLPLEEISALMSKHMVSTYFYSVLPAVYLMWSGEIRQHYLLQVAIISTSFHVDHVNCQCNQKSWMELFVQWNEFL